MCVRERTSEQEREEGERAMLLADLIQSRLRRKVLQRARVDVAFLFLRHEREPAFLPPRTATNLGGGLLLKPAFKLDKDTGPTIVGLCE